MMQSVVEHDAPSLQLSGIKVAAKTGTAQIGSSNQTNDAWVIGFAPADNPKIAVSVVIHNVNQYGVEAAGPIMRSLMEEALKQ
jgi:peptidoglycan glycosyltransferase